MHTILVENVSNFLDQNTHIFTYFISANHGSLVRRVVCVITICRFLFTPIARSFCVSLFSIRVCCELVGSLLSHSFSCVCLTTRTLHMVCSQCVWQRFMAIYFIIEYFFFLSVKDIERTSDFLNLFQALFLFPLEVQISYLALLVS